MVSIYNFLKRSVLRAKGRVRSLGFRLCRAQAFSISEFRARACSTVAHLKDSLQQDCRPCCRTGASSAGFSNARFFAGQGDSEGFV